MPIMTWDQSLDIGVSAMNDDHKQILDAMNRIHAATEAGRTGEEINRLVSRLGEICVAHFKDEESYMASIDFPGLPNHKFVHVALLERYAEHAAQIRSAGGRTDQSFFHFLRHWLTAHIKGIDVKYGEHAAKRTRAA